jgi:NAD(P)-dependent dehydrogenase (short-subunit alcohol dehydrogenase family)
MTSSLLSLEGLHVLVVGGEGRLGKGLRRELAVCGASVSSMDLNAPESESTFDVDVRDPSSVSDGAQRLAKAVGDPEVVINCFTVSHAEPGFYAMPEDYSLDVWQEVVRTDLGGVFTVCQEFGRRMIARGSGVVINSSSIYGRLGVDHRIYPQPSDEVPAMNSPISYSAAKAGVESLTRYLATTWARFGVRVNAVAPGGIAAGQPAEFQAAYSARVPLNRMATPQDVVGPYLFLASPAAAYMTGQVLYVDGGLSAW